MPMSFFGGFATLGRASKAALSWMSLKPLAWLPDLSAAQSASEIHP